MQRFESEAQETAQSPAILYHKIATFHELGKLMPEQIVNWQCDEANCSFEISGMAKIAMKYDERIPDASVRIVSVKAPFPFVITITLLQKADVPATVCRTTLQADLNPMLSMLASRPLQHLVSTINQKLISLG